MRTSSASAKEFLRQARKIETIIRNKSAEREQWREIAESVTTNPDGDRVKSSGNQQKMASAVERYADIDREIEEKIEELVIVWKDIVKTIEELDTAEYDLLHKVYIQGLTLKELAITSGNSESWATTTHGRALQSLQAILDTRECDNIT